MFSYYLNIFKKISTLLFAVVATISLFSKSLAAENCEYFFSIPPVFEEIAYNNYVTLYVLAAEETEIIVEVPAEYLNKKKAKAGAALMFEIDASFGQVLEWNTETRNQAPPKSAIYKNKAIRVFAEKPILCYVICQYFQTSDGFLVFPSSHLDNEYVISSFPDMGGFYGGSFSENYYPSETTITAANDNTNVEFILGGNLATLVNFGDSTYFAGDTIKAELDAGDVWLIMSDGKRHEYPDLSGSKVKSNKPVSVISGNVCANIPIDKPSCDYIATMDFPTKIWGKEYLIPPITRRKNSHLARVYAREDSTIIYYNMQPVDTLFAGEIRNESWLEMRLGNFAPEPAIISGNKPIYVNFFYSSYSEDAVPLSDPFTTSILPREMFRKTVTFATPQAVSSNSFDSNYINIVCAKSFNFELLKEFSITFYDSNSTSLQSLAGDFELISGGDFPAKISGKEYCYFTLKLPKIGTYTINSKTEFACYLYGLANVTAYGFSTFPLSAFAKNNDTEAPGMFADFACDGGVTNGIIKDLPEFGYCSNLNSVILLTNESENIDFNYAPFTAGLSAETSWNLEVQNIRFDATAAVKIADFAGNTDTFRFKYFGLDGMFLEPIRDNICIDSAGSDTLIYELHNPKDTAMFLKLFVVQDENILTLVSPDTILIQANSSIYIKFSTKFAAKNKKQFLVLQKCYESDTIWLPIEFKITNYAINATLSADKYQYSIGDTIKLYLSLEDKNFAAEELKKITEINIKLDYKNIFAELDTASFNLISLPNWNLAEKIILKNLDSSITFLAKLTNNNGLELVESSAVEMNLKLFLPANVSENFYIKSADYKLELFPKIASNYSPCATFYSHSAEILINPVCADDLRLVNISSEKFGISVDAENLTIKYSLGFDCEVAVSVYNSIGEIVQVITSGKSICGKYEKSLAGNFYNSGVYFCELNVFGLARKVVAFAVF